MTVEELIAELHVVLADWGNMPVYVTKTDNGVTFCPVEISVDDIEELDGKLYLG